MENGINTENEIQNYETIYENTDTNSNQYENTENQGQFNQTIQENTIIGVENEKLDLIHQDLGFICSFLIIFTIVGLLYGIYKFFNMFFKI